MWEDKENEETPLVDHIEKKLSEAEGPKLVVIDDLQHDLESDAKNIKLATHISNHYNAFIIIVSYFFSYSVIYCCSLGRSKYFHPKGVSIHYAAVSISAAVLFASIG